MPIQQQPPVGNFSYYPLSACVTQAKNKLGIANTTIHDQKLYGYANAALIRMNSLQMMAVRNIDIKVVDGQATLPNGMIRFLAMRFSNDEGVCFGPYIADFAFLRSCGLGLDGDYADYAGFVMINDNVIEFKFPIEAPKSIKVAYIGKKVDEQGFGMIYDYMVEAVMYFICYNFIEDYPKGYEPWQYQAFRDQWKAQRDRVVGYDAWQSFNNNFNTMVSLTHPQVVTLI